MKSVLLLFAVCLFARVASAGEFQIAPSIGTTFTTGNGLSSEVSDFCWSIGCRITSDSSGSIFAVNYDGNRFSAGQFSGAINTLTVGIRQLFDGYTKGLYFVGDVGLYFANNYSGLVLLPGLGAQFQLSELSGVFVEARYSIGLAKADQLDILPLRAGLLITL